MEKTLGAKPIRFVAQHAHEHASGSNASIGPGLLEKSGAFAQLKR